MKNLLFIGMLAICLAACKSDNMEDDMKPDNTNNTGTCNDSGEVTYSKVIQPLLSAKCYTCHSEKNADTQGRGIKLEPYDLVKARADNGSLLGVIRHETGFSPMPRNGNKLADCDIKKIEKWVAAKSPNN